METRNTTRWILDSGSTSHLFKDKERFNDLSQNSLCDTLQIMSSTRNRKGSNEHDNVDKQRKIVNRSRLLYVPNLKNESNFSCKEHRSRI